MQVRQSARAHFQGVLIGVAVKKMIDSYRIEPNKPEPETVVLSHSFYTR